jgi:non-homologous end joining protein Ku
MRRETKNARRRKPAPKVIDLMEALRASVDDAKAGRASKSASAGRTAKPRSSKAGQTGKRRTSKRTAA